MCGICRQVPCHPRCPNAPEPKPAASCRKCGGLMYIGDRHYDNICEDCLDDMDTSEWLGLFGEDMEEIEEANAWRIWCL